MSNQIAILHYSAPPEIGGVEAVIQAHTRFLTRAGCQVTVFAGRGEWGALPEAAGFELVPEMDSQHPDILLISQELEAGKIPAQFESLTNRLETMLGPLLERFDNIIVHNLFTKHFNLPLTAALYNLLDQGRLPGCIAWCHDFTWSSSHSSSKVHPGYPWDYLRSHRPEIKYVTVSRSRQQELAGLLQIPVGEIKVVYNGVDPQQLLGLSQSGEALVERLGVWDSDLVLLMPVRVTQAKNIEFAFEVVATLKESGIRPTLVISGPPDPHEAGKMGYYRGLLELRTRMELEEEVSFVYQSGPDPAAPNFLEYNQLGELYRVSDLLFMPSHREGFGMPVLEAGLAGLPVISAEIPAAVEIGGQEVITFPVESTPVQVAQRILDWTRRSSQYRLRKRIRQEYTWKAIVHRDILPLLKQSEAA